MSESLGQKRRRFTRLLAEFILKLPEHGYEGMLEEVKRSDEQAEINALGPSGRKALVEALNLRFSMLAKKISNNTGSGIRNSLHEVGLAADISLFKNGVYVESTEGWRVAGELWESMAPDARWGGRFGDGNHISLEHEGKK